MPEPYQPPRDVAQTDAVFPSRESRRISRVALVVSALACLIPVAVACLVDFGLLTVRWDSILLPAGTVLAGLLLSVVGLGLSIGANVKSRSWMSILSIVLSLIAIPLVLFIGFLLAATGLASHPV